MSTVWKRMGSFLGLVEEYEDEYGEEEEPLRAPERERERPAEVATVRPEPSNVRRIAPARVEAERERPLRAGRATALQDPPEPVAARVVKPSGAKVHLTEPTTFNDVEEVGEHFRNGVPVIMNLAGAGESVAKRLLDFASGLIFGLDGRIERVGDRVFLLTPLGVEVSTEERRRLSERGFFNQA
jgi:cell division inhibitor SepF